MVICKLRKGVRYWSARFRSRNHPPLFWHVGTPNFGDDINPSFFEALTGVRSRFATNRAEPHFLGMGSILDRATDQSLVLGSGLLQPGRQSAPHKVISLRGDLTRQAIKLPNDIPLGDPMVLINLLVSPQGGDDIGFIPHVRSLPELKRAIPKGIRLIDVSEEPWKVVRAIGQCRAILSQSLHGLIVADAFEIPNIWITPGDKMQGGRFKFDDYFTTLDAPKQAHSLSVELLRDPPLPEASVGRYRDDKDEYAAILRAALKEGLNT